MDNRIEVLGTDGSRRQLVLFVEEARRAFTLRLARHVALPLGARVLHQDRRFPSAGAPS